MKSMIISLNYAQDCFLGIRLFFQRKRKLLWNRGLKLWWNRLWVRADEEHSSLRWDSEAHEVMEQEQAKAYKHDLEQRRIKARQKKLKKHNINYRVYMETVYGNNPRNKKIRQNRMPKAGKQIRL